MGSKTFVLPRNEVSKKNRCVVAHGYTNDFADSVPALNPGSHGSRDVLALPDVCGNHFVHSKAMYGPQLFRPIL